MNLRLFVALDPPDPVRRRLAAAQAALREAAGRHADGVRWVSPDRMHLTLQFLGSVPEERLPAVRAAVAEAAGRSGPVALRIHGAGSFPSARRVRVLFGCVADEGAGLAALARDLGRALAPLGFPPEGRPFLPHLTFGRSRDARGAPGLGGAIAGASAGAPVTWRAEEVVLFRSRLAPGGAVHEPLERVRLGPAGGG